MLTRVSSRTAQTVQTSMSRFITANLSIFLIVLFTIVASIVFMVVGRGVYVVCSRRRPFITPLRAQCAKPRLVRGIGMTAEWLSTRRTHLLNLILELYYACNGLYLWRGVGSVSACLIGFEQPEPIASSRADSAIGFATRIHRRPFPRFTPSRCPNAQSRNPPDPLFDLSAT